MSMEKLSMFLNQKMDFDTSDSIVDSPRGVGVVPTRLTITDGNTQIETPQAIITDVEQGLSPTGTCPGLPPRNLSAPPDTGLPPPQQQPSDPTNVPKLPKELSVLFVDDDAVLRKLFVRALQRV